MRQYCISTLPFAAFPLTETLAGIRQAGFASAEIARPHLEGLTPGRLAEIAAGAGVRLSSILAGADPATPEGVAQLKSLIRLAAEAGIPRVSLASGGREQSTEAEVDAITANLPAVVAEAEARQVMLRFYAHVGTMAYTLGRTLRVFSQICSQRFGFYYSPYHFHAAGEDPVAALERLRSQLCAVYFNCGPDPRTGKEPFWGPDVDLGRVCRAIADAGYTGEIMLLYLGLKVDRPEPIFAGLQRVRSLLDDHFARLT